MLLTKERLDKLEPKSFIDKAFLIYHQEFKHIQSNDLDRFVSDIIKSIHESSETEEMKLQVTNVMAYMLDREQQYRNTYEV